MELIKRCQIVREDSATAETPGELIINDSFFGYTLEDRVRPKGVYIIHATAIPFGLYELVITFSRRFGIPMPLLLNVQNANPPLLFHKVDISNCGIRVHGGNDEFDTEGCPLLGRRKEPFGDCKTINQDFRQLLTDSLKVNKVFLEIGKIDPESGTFKIPTIW